MKPQSAEYNRQRNYTTLICNTINDYCNINVRDNNH